MFPSQGLGKSKSGCRRWNCFALLLSRHRESRESWRRGHWEFVLVIQIVVIRTGCIPCPRFRSCPGAKGARNDRGKYREAWRQKLGGGKSAAAEARGRPCSPRSPPSRSTTSSTSAAAPCCAPAPSSPLLCIPSRLLLPPSCIPILPHPLPLSFSSIHLRFLSIGS